MLEAIFLSGINEIKVSGLYQWDRGQMLQITCPDLPSAFQVHFAKRKSATSIDVQAESADNVATVAIPDELLQDRFDLYAYLYFDEGVIGETVKTIRMPIKPRAKPDDYVVDLPQEQKTDAEKLIEKMLAEYVEAEVGAVTSASESAAAAQAAAEEAAKAAAEAKTIADSVQDAAVDVDAAKAAREAAEKAQTAAETAQKAAEAAAELAAKQAASDLETKMQDYVSSAETANTAAQEAKEAAEKAAELAAQETADSLNTNMADYVSAAQAAQKAAEEARDQAQAIAGGDFASTTYVDNQIDTHNTATDAHNDIRLLITELTTRLNALADSDDTTLDQMSEVVAYIKSNKSLIDAITTEKVSVSDIIDNLTTNVSTKPLSAAQGVALKALIDAAASAASTAQSTADNKQSKITGTEGQFVVIGSDGNPTTITLTNVSEVGA